MPRNKTVAMIAPVPGGSSGNSRCVEDSNHHQNLWEEIRQEILSSGDQRRNEMIRGIL